MKLILDRENIDNVKAVADFLRHNPADEVVLAVTKNPDKYFKFSQEISKIYYFLDREAFFGIKLIGFPYCVLARGAWDHVKIKTPKETVGEKNKKCTKCKFDKFCNGFPVGYLKHFGDDEVVSILDIPIEVKIEVESKCNFDCIFCFNKVSFAKNKRLINNLKKQEIENIIDQSVAMGIGTVRFTGGEPLLQKDIFELFSYAKKLGLYVKLNTNGSLINEEVAKKMKGVVDNVLISLESYSNKLEEEITKHAGSFEKKIRAVHLLKKAEIPMVRIGTVALRENIENFDKIAKVVLELPLDEWEWFRPVSIGNKKIKFGKNDARVLMDKVAKLRIKTGRHITIGDDLPYCCVDDQNMLNWLSVQSPSNIVIDPLGMVKSQYYMPETFGTADNIKKAWQSMQMKKNRAINNLPNKCRRCRFVLKCRGGSRHEAMIVHGKYSAPDPLMKK